MSGQSKYKYNHTNTNTETNTGTNTNSNTNTKVQRQSKADRLQGKVAPITDASAGGEYNAAELGFAAAAAQVIHDCMLLMLLLIA